MERAHGIPAAELFKTSPELVCEKMGVFLALFHQATENAQGQVMLYTDWSRPNAIIDSTAKVVTAIDPGVRFGEMGKAESDLVTSAWSLATGALGVYRNPRPLIRAFIRAYRAVRPIEVTIASLNANLPVAPLFGKYRRYRFPKNMLARLGPLIAKRYLAPILADQ